MPRDPEGHTQRLCLAQAPDGTIYAAQHDAAAPINGRRQNMGTTLQRDPNICVGWRVVFNNEGVMLNVKPPDNGTPPTVWGSHDEGETWQQIGADRRPAPSDVLSLGFQYDPFGRRYTAGAGTGWSR